MSEIETVPKDVVISRRKPMLVVIALLMTSAVVHGSIDGRWSAKTDLKAQGQKLTTLPEVAGDWRLTSKPEMDESALRILQCHGWDQRQYRNEITGQIITVAVMFGPRGPMAVHTPEVCYDSVGTLQTRDRRVESISTGSNDHKFWSVEFSRKDSPDDRFESWYAWSDGGAFHASKLPRVWMTSSLYKIQLSGPSGNGADQPIQDFLGEFLPQLEIVVE
ncbi:EpsI family protein [Rubripirellula sp.]|nr:EpsI family protein [Rubripirellula sp.]